MHQLDGDLEGSYIENVSNLENLPSSSYYDISFTPVTTYKAYSYRVRIPAIQLCMP